MEPLGYLQQEFFPSAVDRNSPGTEQFRINVTRLRLRAPVVLNRKHTILLPGISYERINVELRGPLATYLTHGNSQRDELTLHAPLLEFGVMQVLDPHWMAVASLLGGLASDFEGAHTSDDINVIGRVILMHRAGEKFTWGLGLSYDRSSRNVSLIPLAVLKWRPAPRFMMTTLLPKAALLAFRASPHVSTGLRAELELSRFHLDEEKYGVDHLFLRYFGILIGPTITLSPSPFVHLDLFSGCALSRRLGAYSNPDHLGLDLYFNTPDPLREAQLQPSAFFNVRLWLGFEGWGNAR